MRILGTIAIMAAIVASMSNASALPSADGQTSRIVIAGQVASAANVFVPNGAGDYSVLVKLYSFGTAWSQVSEDATLHVWTYSDRSVTTNVGTPPPVDIEVEVEVTVGWVHKLAIPFTSRLVGDELVQFNHADVTSFPGGPALLDVVVERADGSLSHYNPVRNALINSGAFADADAQDELAVYPVARGN